MICSVCCRPADEKIAAGYFRCHYCGSETRIAGDLSQSSSPWACPFEKRGDIYLAKRSFRFACDIGRQFDVVIADEQIFDRDICWRSLLVELTKATKHNGWIHIDLARPIGVARPISQAIAPSVLNYKEFKPLRLDIIDQRFTADRQSYFLQKMQEVFPL